MFSIQLQFQTLFSSSLSLLLLLAIRALSSSSILAYDIGRPDFSLKINDRRSGYYSDTNREKIKYNLALLGKNATKAEFHEEKITSEIYFSMFKISWSHQLYDNH